MSILQNPFSLMKLRNILNQSGPRVKFGNPPSPYDDFTSLAKVPVNEDLNENEFVPEHEAIDRYNKIISEEPVYRKPGFLRTLLGGGIAALTGGGPGEARALIDAPYNREMAQFKARLEPAYQAANLERQSNIAGQNRFQQERQFNRQMKADENRFNIEQGRLKEGERAARVREEIARANLTLDQLRESKTLSDRERLQQLFQDRMDYLDQQGVQDIELERLRQAGRVFLKQVSGPDRPETPLAKQQRQYNIAQKLANQEKFAKWVVLTPPNTFALRNGTPPDVRREFNIAVFDYGGDEVKPPVKPTETRVKVIGPNGETGTVSVEESKSLPKGWKVVGG